MDLGRNVALFLSQTGREAFQAVGIPEQSGVAFLYASEIDASGLGLGIGRTMVITSY